jgi:hypothetical protein
MLLHGVSVPALRGGILLRPFLKPVCDDVSPGFSFVPFSLCSGVGLGDGGVVERSTAASASIEDPKELIVISFFVRVFFAKLVGLLSTLYASRRCLYLYLSVYVVLPY